MLLLLITVGMGLGDGGSSGTTPQTPTLPTTGAGQ